MNAELDQQGRLEIARRREDALHGFQQEREEIAEALSARGLLNSGAFLSEVETAASRAFLGLAEGAMTDLTDRARLAFGALNSPAITWIRQQFEEQVIATAIGLGQTVTELRQKRGVPANPDFANRLIFRVRRDLEIRLGRLEFREQFRRLAHPVAKPAVEKQYDLFISHASEDKEAVARPPNAGDDGAWLRGVARRSGTDHRR